MSKKQTTEKWYNEKNVRAFRRMLRDLVKMAADGKLVVGKSCTRKGQVAFNMRVVRYHKSSLPGTIGTLGTYPHENTFSFREATECGTTACAAGWADIRILPMQENEFLHEYATRLIVAPGYKVAVCRQYVLSEWLFDMSWSRIAPGPEAVLIRLNWLVRNGLDELAKMYNRYCFSGSWIDEFWKAGFVKG